MDSPDATVSVRVVELQKSLAHVTRDGVGASALITEEQEEAFTDAGAIPPPYDPFLLASLYEMSSALGPPIRAIMANVDAHGHRFETVFNVNPDKLEEQVGNAILAERIADSDIDESGDLDSLLPSTQEIQDRVKRLRILARVELLKLQGFFRHCCVKITFSELRMQTRQDFEVFGYAFWEILRNSHGEVAQFEYVPAWSMRILPLDKKPTQKTVPVRISEFKISKEPVPVRFRRFVQLVNGVTRFFKEYGDPRVVSQESGRAYKTFAELKKEEGEDAKPAHEVLHFKIHSPRSPYGVPRWVGAWPSILGAREAEEVNFLYFKRKSVPPMAILVQGGGKLAEGMVDRIQDHIQKNMQGSGNFHDVLVLETDGGENVKIDIKILTSAQLKDAQHQKYDERAIDKAGMQFRMPRLLRGDTRDFNRSTADASLRFAEMQIFQPERSLFDSKMDELLRSEFLMRFWRFVSNAPVNRAPEVLAEIIKVLVNAGVLTPEDGRRFSGDIFNERLPHIDEAWVKQPLQLTVAQGDSRE